MIQLIFYFFAAVLVVAALRVITVRNPVHAALFLILAFFSCAAIWMLLHAEFLAITLVLVYVGAVMVLFLFVLMMLDINLDVLREGFARHLPLGITVGLLVLVEMYLVLRAQSFGVDKSYAELAKAASAEPNTVVLGKVLYTNYVYPFEIAAAILLVAMVAAIALTMRGSRQTKYRSPGEQVLVKRSDRVRLVKMPAEKSDS